MKSREFLDILTRVVNSKSGPKFLAILHQLREILEEAGIAEEPIARIEPGKPLRQRAPEAVERRALDTPIAPGEVVPPPAAEASTPAAPDPASPSTAEVESLVASAFIEAGPNHLIRNPESPATPDEPAVKEPERADSIREIVHQALEGGAKTMAQIREIIHRKKGPVSHIVAQVHAAIEKLGAQRGPRGTYGFRIEGPPPPGKRTRKPLKPSLPEGDDPARATGPEASGALDGDEPGPGSSEPEEALASDAPDRLTQLSLLEGLPGARGATRPPLPQPVPGEDGSADPAP